MLGDVNISAILDSFSVSYDKRVRPNYGGESHFYTCLILVPEHQARNTEVVGFYFEIEIDEMNLIIQRLPCFGRKFAAMWGIQKQTCEIKTGCFFISVCFGLALQDCYRLNLFAEIEKTKKGDEFFKQPSSNKITHSGIQCHVHFVQLFRSP